MRFATRRPASPRLDICFWRKSAGFEMFEIDFKISVFWRSNNLKFRSLTSLILIFRLGSRWVSGFIFLQLIWTIQIYAAWSNSLNWKAGDSLKRHENMVATLKEQSNTCMCELQNTEAAHAQDSKKWLEMFQDQPFGNFHVWLFRNNFRPRNNG